jgi:hypothetical protein
MLAEVLLATGLVVTVNVAVVAFAATATLAGTCAAAVLLLVRVTTAPLAGAGVLNVTVAVEVFPPVTEVGLRVTELSTAALTVSVAVFATPRFPEIVTEVLLATGLVVIVNVAVVAFAATVTVAGTCAAAVLLLDRVTAAPPAGADPVRVTVPVEVVPPVTEVGLRVTVLSAAAVTVRAAVFVTPRFPEIVTEALLATGLVVMVNVAVVAFAATVTLAGTCAAAVLLLDRVTTAPPAGAGPFSVTVPVDEMPPTTEVGLRETVLNAAAATVKVPVFVTP